MIPPRGPSCRFLRPRWPPLRWVAIGWVLIASPWTLAEPRGEVGTLVGSLDEAGLYGPPHGRRALDYEYCIPSLVPHREEVARIDPSAQFHEGSPGRIGCGPQELRVTGNSYQPGFRALIERLRALPYVARIEPLWFE